MALKELNTVAVGGAHVCVCVCVRMLWLKLRLRLGVVRDGGAVLNAH